MKKESSGRLPNWVLMVVFLAVLGIFTYLIWPLVTPFIAWLLLVILLLPYAEKDNRAVVLIGLITLGVVIYGLTALWEAFFPMVLALFSLSSSTPSLTGLMSFTTGWRSTNIRSLRQTKQVLGYAAWRR